MLLMTYTVTVKLPSSGGPIDSHVGQLHEYFLCWSVSVPAECTMLKIFQNRYIPIIAFSIHAYWRLNQSLSNPVCTELPKYHCITYYGVSCRLNYLAQSCL